MVKVTVMYVTIVILVDTENNPSYKITPVPPQVNPRFLHRTYGDSESHEFFICIVSVFAFDRTVLILLFHPLFLFCL